MPDKKITRLVVGAIETNCWLYPLGEKEAAVIDPGAEEGLILSALRQLNLIPRYILLTHGHFDHIAALPELAAACASANPPLIAIHRLDAKYLGADAYKVHRKDIEMVMGASYIDVFLPAEKREMPPAGRLLEDGETIGPFTVLHLPGHTGGSAAFWDKDEDVLFTGDTLFNGDYGRTDLPDGNEQDIFASLRRLFAMDGNIRVYPGHGGTTTIAREASQALV
jgi:glyoxylase-like metal-dependent hydrolase (beta-lactamase superfamily II)